VQLRKVRLDDETEKVLEQIVKTTQLSISDTLKKGLFALRDDLSQKAERIPYGIYEKLDLGPGGYAIAPAKNIGRKVWPRLP